MCTHRLGNHFHSLRYVIYVQLGLSGSNSLGILLKNVRVEVRAALEELTVITTHDDNLEKQYKESEWVYNYCPLYIRIYGSKPLRPMGKSLGQIWFTLP